jgi:hypothetical protein
MRLFATRRFRAAPLLLAACLLPFAINAVAAVPSNIQEKLRAGGINLTFWFTYRDNPKIEPRMFWPDASDIAQLRRIGFRHVRVPFERAWIADPTSPSRVNPARAEEYVGALERLAGEGLLVVATLTSTNDDIARMLTDKGWRDTTSGLWWSLAKQLTARIPPDRLIIEVLNEPANEDPAASMALMQTLAGAVRDAAPKYTIAVAGHKYSSVDELVQLKPFQDDNLVYTFHFYEPMNFTHQGAWWGWPMWAKLKGLPYPSNEFQIDSVLDYMEPDAQPHARYYGQQNWNKAKLAEVLGKAAQWQADNKVPVWCSEFGAIKTVAPAGSRDAWLRDTRSLLQERGMGWTHFDFAQHMGIADGPQGRRQWDRGAIQALGMTPPP